MSLIFRMTVPGPGYSSSTTYCCLGSNGILISHVRLRPREERKGISCNCTCGGVTTRRSSPIRLQTKSSRAFSKNTGPGKGVGPCTQETAGGIQGQAEVIDHMGRMKVCNSLRMLALVNQAGRAAPGEGGEREAGKIWRGGGEPWGR